VSSGWERVCSGGERVGSGGGMVGEGAEMVRRAPLFACSVVHMRQKRQSTFEVEEGVERVGGSRGEARSIRPDARRP